MKSRLKILYAIYIYFYSTFACSMSINPDENLFAQLPQNVRDLIGYFVVIDLIKEQESNPQKKPFLKKENALIAQRSFFNLRRDEAEVFNLIEQGWNYRGISDNRELYVLLKPTFFRIYNCGLITFNHHEILYSRVGNKTNYTCIFKQQTPSPSIDDLLRINQFIHPDSFEFLGYFPSAHAIAIRLLNSENRMSNNDILVIQLPNSPETKPFLDDYFYRTTVCKRLLMEGGQE